MDHADFKFRNPPVQGLNASVPFIACSFRFLRQSFCTVQAGLELSVFTRLALYMQRSCLLSAVFTGIHHHTKLPFFPLLPSAPIPD